MSHQDRGGRLVRCPFSPWPRRRLPAVFGAERIKYARIDRILEKMNAAINEHEGCPFRVKAPPVLAGIGVLQITFPKSYTSANGGIRTPYPPTVGLLSIKDYRSLPNEDGLRSAVQNVTEPVAVPRIKMFTPGNPIPSSEDVTFPDIVRSWATT